MKNKKIVFALIAVVVIGLIVGGNAFMKDRAQRARYTAQRELADQLGNICSGTGAASSAAYAASGQHPVIYAVDRPMGYTSDAFYYTPLTWKANSLDEMQLVACITEEETELEQCSYDVSTGGKAVLIRAQYQVVVTLREAQTGAVVATSDVIKGDLPRECQVSEEFTAGELTQYVTGARPSDLIDEWLKPFVEAP